MLNKNDPLIGAVQQVMQQSNAEREATRLVNEAFGIEDRKALPHEYQAEWDSAYQQVLSEGKIAHPNQQKLDVHEPEKDELTSDDFRMLRAMRFKKKKNVAEATFPGAPSVKMPKGMTPSSKHEKAYNDHHRELKSLADSGKINTPAGKKQASGLIDRIQGLVDKHLPGNPVPSKKIWLGEQMKDPNARDVTSPSSMGIEKPNYAAGTPDYAKPKTQTVNRAAKTSLPAGTLAKTMKEEEQLDEVLDTPKKRMGYGMKAIGSYIKASLTGDKNTKRKRLAGNKNYKKKVAQAGEKQAMDSYREKKSGKVLRDMGRKTGLGQHYDKIFKEEHLNEKSPPGREDQVKALKKKFPVDSAFRIAWSSYNKSKKKKEN